MRKNSCTGRRYGLLKLFGELVDEMEKILKEEGKIK